MQQVGDLFLVKPCGTVFTNSDIYRIQDAKRAKYIFGFLTTSGVVGYFPEDVEILKRNFPRTVLFHSAKQVSENVGKIVRHYVEILYFDDKGIPLWEKWSEDPFLMSAFWTNWEYDHTEPIFIPVSFEDIQFVYSETVGEEDMTAYMNYLKRFSTIISYFQNLLINHMLAGDISEEEIQKQYQHFKTGH